LFKNTVKLAFTGGLLAMALYFIIKGIGLLR
jgi:hypothetical protein